MFDKFKREPPRPRKERLEGDDCEIEVKKTQHGKKIKFKGRCSPQQMKILADANGINLGDE